MSPLKPFSQDSRFTARLRFASVAFLLTAFAGGSQRASSQACTGLCLQQVSCPAGQTTTISGTVYAPNGIDPLPNVLVYIPNAPVDPFTDTVTCMKAGTPPSGSPVAGTISNADGTFQIINVPVGANIPLVIQAGKWRRQVTVPGTTACVDTPFSTRMPQNQSEGDIPHIAVTTGSADGLECVLRKIGVSDTEFTSPYQNGRINLFAGGFRPGANPPGSTASQATLMADKSVLNSYDILMFPCEGGTDVKPAAQLSNLVDYTSLGGRVFATHYSMGWLRGNGPFNGAALWNGTTGSTGNTGLSNANATINTTFPDGQTLAQWLQVVGASTTYGQIPLKSLFNNQSGVVAPTQSVMTLNTTGSPVVQLTFNTPIGALPADQCGRVLYNEYHVEPGPGSSSTPPTFPDECENSAMNAQEKLLEYSLFDLSGDTLVPTLAPAAGDFGSQIVGTPSPTQTFTFSHTSIFPVGVSNVSGGSDYTIVSNTCRLVPAGGNCQITVSFKPTGIGPRNGSLVVTYGGTSISVPLVGSGLPSLVASGTVSFPAVDVGARAAQSLLFSVKNVASFPVPMGAITGTAEFPVTGSTCTGSLAAGASCTVSLGFAPTATAARGATITVVSSDPALGGTSLGVTGTGVDFAITALDAGTVIAGYSTKTTGTLSPISDFAFPVTLSCTTATPGSTCALTVSTLIPSRPMPYTVTITTTSKYAGVVGYSGLGGSWMLFGVGTGLGLVLWLKRRNASRLLQTALVLALMAGAGMATTGCSGKLPSLNPISADPGTYTYTVTATDGFLKHSADFKMNIVTK